MIRLGARVEGSGLGSGFQGSGFRVQGWGQGLGFRVQGSRLGSGFRVQGSRLGSGFRRRRVCLGIQGSVSRVQGVRVRAQGTDELRI